MQEINTVKPTHETTAPAWVPSPRSIDAARVTGFMRWLESERGLAFADYDALWQWSAEAIGDFWSALWDWAAIRSTSPREQTLADAAMPGAVWFPVSA